MNVSSGTGSPRLSWSESGEPQNDCSSSSGTGSGSSSKSSSSIVIVKLCSKKIFQLQFISRDAS